MSPCSSHFFSSSMRSIRPAVQLSPPCFVILHSGCAPGSSTCPVLLWHCHFHLICSFLGPDPCSSSCSTFPQARGLYWQIWCRTISLTLGMLWFIYLIYLLGVAPVSLLHKQAAELEFWPLQQFHRGRECDGCSWGQSCQCPEWLWFFQVFFPHSFGSNVEVWEEMRGSEGQVRAESAGQKCTPVWGVPALVWAAACQSGAHKLTFLQHPVASAEKLKIISCVTAWCWRGLCASPVSMKVRYWGRNGKPMSSKFVFMVCKS